jgi:hypothetical protein
MTYELRPDWPDLDAYSFEDLFGEFEGCYDARFQTRASPTSCTPKNGDGKVSKGLFDETTPQTKLKNEATSISTWNAEDCSELGMGTRKRSRVRYDLRELNDTKMNASSTLLREVKSFSSAQPHTSDMKVDEIVTPPYDDEDSAVGKSPIVKTHTKSSDRVDGDGHVVAESDYDLLDLLGGELAGRREDERLALLEGNVELGEGSNGEGGSLSSSCAGRADNQNLNTGIGPNDYDVSTDVAPDIRHILDVVDKSMEALLPLACKFKLARLRALESTSTASPSRSPKATFSNTATFCCLIIDSSVQRLSQVETYALMKSRENNLEKALMKRCSDMRTPAGPPQRFIAKYLPEIPSATTLRDSIFHIDSFHFDCIIINSFLVNATIERTEPMVDLSTRMTSASASTSTSVVGQVKRETAVTEPAQSTNGVTDEFSTLFETVSCRVHEIELEG